MKTLPSQLLILMGIIFIVAMMILFFWLASEFAAWQLHFARQLGEANHLSLMFRTILIVFSLIALIGFGFLAKEVDSQFSYGWVLSLFFLVAAFLPIYSPMDFITWLLKYGDDTDATIWYVGTGIILMGALLSISGYRHIVKYRRLERKSNTHGSASFASLEEIDQAKLMNNEDPYAIYVGAFKDVDQKRIHYLRYSGESHVGVIAPARSGKGAGIIIPNLLSYRGNVIVLDLKLENYHNTAGFRKSIGHQVIKLDFSSTDGTAARFNPLFEIRKGIHEIKDTQNMVNMIADPDGKGRSDHWTETASGLLVSVILHVLYIEKDKSLTGVRHFLSNLQLNSEELFNYMMTAIHDPNSEYGWRDPQTGLASKTHPIVAMGAKDMLDRAAEERSGIVSTVKRFLKLYIDNVVANNTSTSDFSISDIINPNHKISLYIGLSPSEKERLKPLIRIFISQLLSRITETWIAKDKRESLRAPVLLVMDEVAQLGKLDFFSSSLAYTAGYGLKTLLVFQDLSQLYEIYSQNQSITSHCDVLTVYAPNKLETAQYFSNMLGAQTIVQSKENYSGNRFSPLLNHVNKTEHEIKRLLLTPDELMRMPSNESIIFKNGMRAIHGEKVMFWQDPIFKERSNYSAPIRSDVIDHDCEWQYAAEYAPAIKKEKIQKKKKAKENNESKNAVHQNDDFDLL